MSPFWVASRKRSVSSSWASRIDVEARALVVDVAPRAGRELARVVLALADDLGDLVVGVAEHLAQQEHRALDRATAARAARGRRATASRPARRWALGSRGASSVSSGSGSHGPTYSSRRARAERRWSMARRVVTADR